jgi:hypothetical protein
MHTARTIKPTRLKRNLELAGYLADLPHITLLRPKMATIRNAGITGDFVHEPLKDPGSEIRLISVEASDEQEDDIECTISTHAINEAPPYAAISYTWGSMSHKRSIRLNDKLLDIGQNSWTVLWQVRLHEIAVPVWIDVLSIDQANDVEKSIQVGMMGVIYKTAKVTFVSLGSHEDDSDLLAEQTIAHTDHIESMRDLCTGGEHRMEPLFCTACRSLLTHRIYRCLQCDESVKFCEACEGAHHDETKHDVYPDRSLENNFQGQCVECGQPLSLRWCEPKDSLDGHLLKVCKKCAQVHLDEPHGELWRSGYVLTDEYGPLTQSVGYKPSLQKRMETYARFFELSQETHQRLIDALRSLSLRAYFNRLWVCLSNRLRARRFADNGLTRRSSKRSAKLEPWSSRAAIPCLATRSLLPSHMISPQRQQRKT